MPRLTDSREFHFDRMAVSALAVKSPEALKLLRDKDLGKTNSRETVHFCGMAHADHKDAHFFYQDNQMARLAIAKKQLF